MRPKTLEIDSESISSVLCVSRGLQARSQVGLLGPGRRRAKVHQNRAPNCVKTPADWPPVSAVILAGGENRRMGTDKAFLLVSGRPLVAHTVDKLLALSDDLIIVTNRSGAYRGLALPVRLVPDERPGVGALMGIYSGLKAARHSYALVIACDMPFLSLPLLTYMLGLVRGHDVVIPRLDGMLEPTHAVYGKRCLVPIQRLLDRGERQIIAFFSEVRVRYVESTDIEPLDPLHLSFVNVNTADDWNRVQRQIGA